MWIITSILTNTITVGYEYSGMKVFCISKDIKITEFFQTYDTLPYKRTSSPVNSVTPDRNFAMLQELNNIQGHKEQRQSSLSELLGMPKVSLLV